MDKKNEIKDFENIRNLAELKALSKHSLENPLIDEQYTKMMMLKNSLFPMSDEEFKEKSIRR